MEEILKKVMQRLREEVPELKWIDLNIGQMMMENPPVDYPCALIDVPRTEYSDASAGMQVGIGNRALFYSTGPFEHGGTSATQGTGVCALQHHTKSIPCITRVFRRVFFKTDTNKRLQE